MFSRREEEEGISSAELKVGRLVHVRSLDADGRIVQLAQGGRVTVDLEGIRVLTDRFDLAPPRQEHKVKSHSPLPLQPSVGRVSLQLNVRGMTVTEALREVESYLDRLLLADVRQASILHGKGTGALQDAVRNYLSSCSFVGSCGPAPPREGGEGVTLFELMGEEKD